MGINARVAYPFAGFVTGSATVIVTKALIDAYSTRMRSNSCKSLHVQV